MPRPGIDAIDRYPVVIKADGLAAGKGVMIAGTSRRRAPRSRTLLVERRFGTERVLVEEHLDGEELLAAGGVRRVTARAAGLRPGLQADLRLRPRPEHRRNGVLLAGPGDRCGRAREL